MPTGTFGRGIHEDATWEFINSEEDVNEYGTLWVDATGITLHFDGGATCFAACARKQTEAWLIV